LKKVKLTRGEMAALGLPSRNELKTKQISPQITTGLTPNQARLVAFNTGRTMPPELRAKISAANKGRALTSEHKAKLSASNKGKKFSEEHRHNMSEAQKGKILSPEFIEHLRNLAASQKGKSLPRERVEKAAEAHRKLERKLSEELKAKLLATRLGSKHTAESKAKMSETRILIGPRLKPTIYPITWNEALREKIRERDERCCQKCWVIEDFPKLQVHHIDHDKQNLSENNLISLCLSCHRSIHNKDIEYWKIMFAIMNNGRCLINLPNVNIACISEYSLTN
jgi:hypothetical protein